MTIVREGYPFVLGSFVPGALMGGLYPVHQLTGLFIIGLILLVLGVGCAAFFRNPSRKISTDEAVLLAPADGRVLQILEIEDDYVGQAFRIDIFLSIFDVHLNRIPMAGEVEFIKYRAGKFISAYKKKASEDNERNDIGIQGQWGRTRVAQIAGLIARRIVCSVRETDKVKAGQLYGMIRFGSRTELTFCKKYKPCVSPGQHVKGGETIMGKLINNG
jgi:phosphatidylserine decarboxylase